MHRSQAIDGHPFQGDHVSGSVHAHSEGEPRSLYTRPSLQLAAPSQLCCLTGARLDDKVLSLSRNVSSFLPAGWHSTEQTLDGAAAVHPCKHAPV